MPGPMSAPNGHKRLVEDHAYRKGQRDSGGLRTGKTSKVHNGGGRKPRK